MKEAESPGRTRGRWQTLGWVLLFWAGWALLWVGLAPVAGVFPKPWRQGLTAAAISAGTLAMTALLVRRDGLRLADVGAAPRRGSLPRFALGFLLGLTLVALNAVPISMATGIRFVRVPEAGGRLAAMMLLTYVAFSCSEELGFRGYPLRRLHRAFGLWVAQAVVAVAFAVAHVAGGQPWLQALVGTGAGSLLFGMAAIATRGLALPIGLHAAWNFAEWALGGKGSPGLWQVVAESGRSSGTLGSVSYLAVMGLGTIAFWLWHRRNAKRHNSVKGE